jgi:hypothetical protein
MTCRRVTARGIRDLPRALTQRQTQEGGRQGSYLAVEDAGLCPRHAGLHPPQVAVDYVLRRCGAGVFHSRASLAGPKLAQIDSFLRGGVEGGGEYGLGLRFRVRHACILSLPAGTRCLRELMPPRRCASARTISLVPVYHLCLACLHHRKMFLQKKNINPLRKERFVKSILLPASPLYFFFVSTLPFSWSSAAGPLGSRWAPHDVKH